MLPDQFLRDRDHAARLLLQFHLSALALWQVPLWSEVVLVVHLMRKKYFERDQLVAQIQLWPHPESLLGLSLQLVHFQLHFAVPAMQFHRQFPPQVHSSFAPSRQREVAAWNRAHQIELR